MSSSNQYDSLDKTQTYYPQGQRPSSQHPNMGPTDQFSIESLPPKRRGFPCGCFLGGCLVSILLLVLAAGLGTYFLYSWYHSQLLKYTSETSLELPSMHITQQDVDDVVAKLEEFREQFDLGDAPQELILTEEEINTLIARNPELKGRIYISIVEDNLRAEVSFPMDQWPGGRGRFFNGSATLQIELEDGVLIARAVDVEVNGLRIPEPIMEPVRRENIAEPLNRDSEISKTLQRCKQLIIESNRIILKVRPIEDASSVEAPESS